MAFDLAKFLLIWFIQLASFSSVAVLAFGNLESFGNFNSSIVYFIEASLGNFDLENFASNNENMRIFGEWFHILFLLFNLILMLNLVIAILSESFSSLNTY